MRILVSIKQVPDVATLRLDPATNRLVRDGVSLFANPFDLRAIALAVRFKAEEGCEVVAVTMGPPAAREVLALARAAGADRCILVCDPALAGSDTLVTARVLARVVERENPDIVITGQYSVDSETGQVPEQMAACLSWPCIPAVREVSLDVAQRNLRARVETDDGSATVDVPLPLVLTTAERLIAPAKAQAEELDAVRKAPVDVLDAASLGFAPDHVGLKGSPTWVAEVRPVSWSRTLVMLEGGGPDDRARRAVELVLERGVLDKADRTGHRAWPRSDAADSAKPSVWALAESDGGRLRPVSGELVGLAKTLAAGTGGEAVALLLGRPGVEGRADELIAAGADRVLAVVDDRLDPYTSQTWGQALSQLLGERRPPMLVIGGATRIGRGTLARVSATDGLGMTGDCIDVQWDEEGRLMHLKPAFGGNVVAPIYCATAPQLTTIVPGYVKRLEPMPGRKAQVEIAPAACGRPAVRVEASEASARADANALDQAELVLCVGNAIAGPEDVEDIRRHLDLMQDATGLIGALAASRRVTDQGWMPRQTQVGLTGRAIAPRLYIGVGVRGAAYHLVGIRQVGTIVAINNDPKAPIFEAADIGLLGDWREVLAALSAAFQAARSAKAAPEVSAAADRTAGA
ncbi:MAG: FAD-binding protein [Kiloniellaceae bacterium]